MGKGLGGFVFAEDIEVTASEYLDKFDEVAGLIDFSCDGEHAGALSFLSDESDLLEGCPEAENAGHVLQVHVSELLSVVSVEETCLVHIAKRPQIVHNFLVGHSNG